MPVAHVGVNFDPVLALIRDAGLAGENVVGNNGASHVFAQLDLWFVLLKFAAVDKDSSTLGLNGVTPFLVSVPLYESAITEGHCSLAGDRGDLIARSPECTVHETHTAGIVPLHANYGRVRAVEGREFAVGNEQAKWSRVFNEHRCVAIIGANA